MGTAATREHPSTYIKTKGTRVSAPAHNQLAGTCYAYSTATIVRATLKRIDDWHVPQHDTLCYDIIQAFGTKGGHPEKVLPHLQQFYPIRWEVFDSYDDKVRDILNNKKRPLLVAFYLCGKGWRDLSNFFAKNGNKILRKADISCNDKWCKDPAHNSNQFGEAGGHAVVIEKSFNRSFFGKECFRIKNSWGENFGDNGYFNVESDALQFYDFIDVYYVVPDLNEFKYEHGKILAKELKLKNEVLKFYYLKRIGRGSFGTVYEADNGYVVKVIENDSIENKTPLSKWECGRREVLAYKKYGCHPRIAQYIDDVALNNRMYLVLKRYKHGTLAHKLNQQQELYSEISKTRVFDRLPQNFCLGNFPLLTMFGYMSNIVEGLAYIHSKGYIHRDINPHNLFIEDDRCYVGDFGLTLFAKSQNAMDDKTVYGTEGYIAPEIIENRDYDQSVDIYSLGIIFGQVHLKHTSKRDPFTGFDQILSLFSFLSKKMTHSSPRERPTIEKVRKFFSLDSDHRLPENYFSESGDLSNFLTNLYEEDE